MTNDEDKNPWAEWLTRVVAAAVKAGVVEEGDLWTKTIEDLEDHFASWATTCDCCNVDCARCFP